MNAPIWSVGFRPFFVLVTIHALVFPALWLAVLSGHTWPGAPTDPVGWHAREMLIGFVGAAMAGFLLTAVPTFTARPARRGLPLVVLAAVWVAGRAGGLLETQLPLLAPAADLTFGLGLLGIVAGDIVVARNRRNFVLVGIVAAWVALAGALHAGFAPAAALLHLELALLTVIAGRIIPAFTGNWMRQRGLSPLPQSHLPLDLAVLVGVVLAGAADVAGTGGPIAALGFGAVALAHAWRLAGWRGPRVVEEPLLWSLHLAYAWLPVGYLLLAAAALAPADVPRSGALHALTIGVIGSMVLSVMPRVTLGHTGRALHARPSLALAFGALWIAAAARVLVSLWPQGYGPLLVVSGLAWLAGYATFAVLHVPMLFRPRADVAAGE